MQKQSDTKIFIKKGIRIGHLEVLKFDHSNGRRDSSSERRGDYWKVRCDCGNERVVRLAPVPNKNNPQTCSTRSGERCHFYYLARTKDLTGQKINSLTILERVHKHRNSGVYYRAKCDCGNIGVQKFSSGAKGGSFTTNPTSCGCQNPQQNRRKDETGNQYGKLLVIGEDCSKERNPIWWNCRCDCGVTTSVRGTSLRLPKSKGGTRACYHCNPRFVSGEGAAHWDPDLDPEYRKRPRKHEHRQWSEAVRARDQYQCCACGFQGNLGDNQIVAHHIESYHDNRSIRYELSNGITMCRACHMKFHHAFGYKKNTKKHLSEFLSDLLEYGIERSG